MEKSPFTAEHRALVALLRERREAADLTQEALAKRLRVTQSRISKWERGDRRIDVVQLRKWCHATGDTLPAFVKAFEKRLARR